MWDVGGQEKLRPLWKPYTRATDGIIFVVDSCDTDERLEESKLELHRILRTPDNADVPVLVIANKQDLPEARSQDVLEKVLSVNEVNEVTISIKRQSYPIFDHRRMMIQTKCTHDISFIYAYFLSW